ncbi:MAG: alkaline phosphatase family protein [Gemmatimonadetes bacterium]|nr:alkaline phosphatase family protein [Gemmatimonadota bacterium]
MSSSRRFHKVVVVGLDGLEPTIVERMLEAGEMPHLRRLRNGGGLARVRTTSPAQTPVAWSTFATGVNPGGHGIFDFIRRDPRTYLPDFSLNRYEQKNAFLPPRAVNLRRGTPVWELLSAAGIPSTVVRCPCTFPPDVFRGRMLAGMGVPDLRGGLGTSTFYTSAEGVKPEESENVITLRGGADGTFDTHVIGPRNPRTRGNFEFPLRIRVDRAAGRVVLASEGQPRALDVAQGAWSGWLRVRFKTGLLQSVSGVVRFHLRGVDPLELHASPVNFDPEAPLFPVGTPAEYPKELADRLGTFYTTGMVEDHGGLNNGRFDEVAYLDQCNLVLAEREAMLQHELARLDDGLLFCLFDTPDRVQHMFWRFREPDHPANRDGDARANPELARVIEENYRACDAIVGRALEHVDDRTLCVVLSDHGFSSFQRGVNLNTWLHDQGLLALQTGVRPGEAAGDMLRHVDWERTRAYALGLGSVYLNLQGREAKGIVASDEAPTLRASIAAGLTGLADPDRAVVAVRGASTREQAYAGPYVEESPDVVVNFAAGYRASWSTALGGIPEVQFEDNVKRWGGDHIIDPELVPGVLLMNRPFDGAGAHLRDLAPTILAALGAPRGPAMEGESLLP